MLRTLCRLPKVAKKLNGSIFSTRNFLSDAYKCTEAWENRLKAPIFKKIDYDDLYYQLEKSIQIGYRISVLDMDLFANGIQNEHLAGELEDILFKIRLNPETGIVYDSTGHAVVRYFLSIGQKEDLIRILSDRLNYGVYPDSYLSNIMMDTFLKENDVVSAVKVSTLPMLQEEFNHPITRALSMHSCFKYLNSSDVWLPPQEPEEDPEEEVVKIRVSYLRNPYFDNHFDLVNTNHLIGKTLLMNGRECTEAIGKSCELVGLALFEKFTESKSLVEEIMKGKIPVHEEAVKRAKEYFEKPPKLALDKTTVTDEVQQGKEQVLKALGVLERSGNLLPSSLESDSEQLVIKAVAENELQDIDNQCKVYKLWEEEREEHIQYEIRENKKMKAAADIQKTKEELVKEEDELFFFDNEDNWNLLIEGKEESRSKVYKWQDRGHKNKDEDYIPPEVHHRN